MSNLARGRGPIPAVRLAGGRPPTTAFKAQAGAPGVPLHARIREQLLAAYHRTRPLTFQQRGGSRVPGFQLGHNPSDNLTDMFHHQPLEASE